MFIYAADKQYIGGYGDRLVGLVTCKVMADLLGRNFRILWTNENIRPYLNYDIHDYENELKYDTIRLDFIDKQHELRQQLPPFEDDVFYLFNLNQNIAQYLYKNSLYAHRDYYRDMFTAYEALYTRMLVPTPALIEQVQSFMPRIAPAILGIQIRTGDMYIRNVQNNAHVVIRDPEAALPGILSRIKEHAERTFCDYKIFLTSDYEGIYTIACKVWTTSHILYNHLPIQHMDRANNGDILKIIMDHYILSQKTDRLYISHASNFGRVAALSNKNAQCYTLDCDPIDKRTLLCKHETAL